MKPTGRARRKKAPGPDAKPSESDAKPSESDASATEGAAKASGRTAKPKAPTGAAEAPAFGKLSGKQVASVVAKLAKLTEGYKADALFDQAGPEWGEPDRLRWHIARHGLLPATHPTLLRRLGETAERASADDVFAVLPRLASPQSSGELEVLPGWSRSADTIALRAMELDPARLEALLEGASPQLRDGIQLVRGRCGAALGEEDRQRVLRGLASTEATGYGIPRSYGQAGTRLYLQTLGPDGKRVEPYREALDLARVFGSEEAWCRALAEAAKRGKFGNPERVLLGLAVMPLAEMVATLAAPHLPENEENDRTVAELVVRRGDDPHDLAAAALTIPPGAKAGVYVREQLLLHALARMAARGVSIPAGLEAQVRWERFTYCVPPWRGSAVQRAAYRKALEALPRERALALTTPILERSYGQSQALAILSVHYDEDVARKLVATRADQGLADPSAFGALGAPAIPLLREALSQVGTGAEEDKRRAALTKCLRAVLGFVGASGGTFDASLDELVSCAPEESYWPEESRTLFLHMLRALPEARRVAALEKLLAETRQVERAFYGVGTVEDAAFRAKAARVLVRKYRQVQDRTTLQLGLKSLGEGGLASFRDALLEEKPDTKIFEELRNVFGYGPVDAIMKEAHVVEEKKLARLFRLAKERLARRPGSLTERVYLLERRDLDGEVPSRRAGSFSTSRGAGPGSFERGGAAPVFVPDQVFSIDQVLAMKKRAAGPGADDEHVLTLDLEEIPELSRRFPGARAISLFAPDPDQGDGWERATLVAVPTGASAPTDGTPITVMALEVPSAIFDRDLCKNDPELKELRSLLFNRPGYVLGEPMYIQEDEDGGIDFVMQLGERIADLNLGDSGSLYVFEGSTFMQCY